jgi:hypothetical protein
VQQAQWALGIARIIAIASLQAPACASASPKRP